MIEPTEHGVPCGVFLLLVVIAASLLTVAGCTWGRAAPERDEQSAQSTEKVESETTAAPRVESGGNSTVNTRLEKKMNTIQTSVQEMQKTLHGATSSMQDKLARTIKGVRKIEQNQTTETTNYGLSAQRRKLESSRLDMLHEYRFRVLGAVMGLLVVGLFAPAPFDNPIVTWAGVGGGVAAVFSCVLL